MIISSPSALLEMAPHHLVFNACESFYLLNYIIINYIILIKFYFNIFFFTSQSSEITYLTIFILNISMTICMFSYSQIMSFSVSQSKFWETLSPKRASTSLNQRHV